MRYRRRRRFKRYQKRYRKTIKRIPKGVLYKAPVYKAFTFVTNLFVTTALAGTYSKGMVGIKMYDPTAVAYSYQLSGTGTVTPQNDIYTGVVYASEIVNWTDMYDMMRVHAVKIVYTPAYNIFNMTSTSGSTIQAATVTPIWVWWDPDNLYNNPQLPNTGTATNGTGLNNAYFLNYDSVKQYTSTRKFKRYLKCPKLTGAGSGNATQVFQKGYYNAQVPVTNGIIYVYASNAPLNYQPVGTQIGTLTIKYYISFKNRF